MNWADKLSHLFTTCVLCELCCRLSSCWNEQVKDVKYHLLWSIAVHCIVSFCIEKPVKIGVQRGIGFNYDNLWKEIRAYFIDANQISACPYGPTEIVKYFDILAVI